MPVKFVEPSEGNTIFKFNNLGDRFEGRFLARRSVKTKQQESARALDVQILESIIVNDRGEEAEGPTGNHTVFESDHITQLMDAAKLQPGDGFRLCFGSRNPKSRFKKFGFERMTQEELDAYNEPPPEFFDDARA
jgi:hypothetical protein